MPETACEEPRGEGHPSSDTDVASDDADLAPEQHRTSTAERGSFRHAACSCGWRGPARRARALAADDADAHVRAPG